MTETRIGKDRPTTIDYLPLINSPLPERVHLGDGVLLFEPVDPITVAEDGRTAQFPAYTCLFRSNEGEQSDLSSPIAKFPDFRIRYVGSQDSLFTIPQHLIADPSFHVIGFDSRQLFFSKYGLVHEQGHAFLNRNRLSLRLLQAAHSGKYESLPNYPNIGRYCDAVAEIPGIRAIQYPQTEHDIDVMFEKNSEIRKGLLLFEERYAWGVGLAMSTLYPGYVRDWLNVAGLEAAAIALVSYARDNEDIRFNDGFSKEDSIGNLAYFFAQEFQG